MHLRSTPDGAGVEVCLPERLSWLTIAGLVIVAAGLLCAACQSDRGVPGRQPIVRLVSDTGVGNIGEPLAQEYARSLPGIDVRLLDAVGSVRTVEALQHGEADLGFTQADVAYFAHLRVAEQSDPALEQIRGIAVLQITPLHLLARSDLPIRDVSDVRSFKVRTGPETPTGQGQFAELVLRAHGVDPDTLERKAFLSALIVDELMSGSVDVAFTTAYYPAPKVFTAMSRGAKLIPIDGPAVRDLIHEYPFVRRVSIPAHTYPGQSRPIRTIGVYRVLVCRSGLGEEIVHDLTKRFLETLPQLSSSLNTSLRLMTLEESPATPIPLHAGAARYYRERELAQ